MAKDKEPKPPKPAKTSLDLAMAEIKKKYGDGSIRKGRSLVANVEAWSTNIATLDIALGCGGLPKGRIIEVFGPESAGKTTTALTFIAAAQEQGMIAAFVDVEHALDPKWATALGVKMDDLILSQPDSAEEALDIVETLAKTGEIAIVVLDSVAALTPKAELDGEVGDSHIGLQARLMSQAMRKLKGECSKTGTVCLFINQIREKIGVMFGCLHGSTMINFVDGRSLTIAEVVENEVQGDVWSYDESSGQFVPRPIIDWHHNGDVGCAEDYLSIAAKGPGTKNGRIHITVTPDHWVMTDTGWVAADELYVGCKLLTRQECLGITDDGATDGTLGQFLTGVLVGDSHTARNGIHLGSALKLQDNIDPAYAEWKVDKLDRYLHFNRRTTNSRRAYISAEHPQLLQLRSEYPKRDPMFLLERFSWLGFAVWLMDDAVYERGRYNLSIRRLSGDLDKIEQVSRAFDELGLYHHAGKSGYILFDKSVSDRIAENVAKFVPPCMDRKLPVELRGKYVDFELSRESDLCKAFATVLSIRTASGRQMRTPGKYDITIAGTSCYSAGNAGNGVIVHNSNETTPGGRALKFYASVRMEIKRNGESTKKGELKIGNPTKAKIVKNKVGPPFVVATYNIMFGAGGYAPGIDKVESMMTVANETPGVFEKAGSWLTFGDKRFQGIAQWKEYVQEHPEIFTAIKEKTYSIALKSPGVKPLIEMTDEEIAALDPDEDDESDALEQTIAAQPVVVGPENDDD